MTETHKDCVPGAPLKILLWPFLMACVLSVTTLTSSSTSFRIDQDTLIPLFTLSANDPEEVIAWEVAGDIENTNLNYFRPTLWSKNPNRTVVKSFQRFDSEKHRNNSFVVINASVSRANLPYGLETNNKFGSLDSAIVVQSNSESSNKYSQEHLFKLLDPEHQSQSWTTISGIDSRTNLIKIQMLLQTPGAWTLEQLDISSVSLSANYIVFVVPLAVLWGAFWFFLIRHIAKHLERGKHRWLRFIGLSTIAMMMLGAVLSRSVFSPLRSFLVPANAIISMDLALHIIAHFIFSIVVLVFRRNSWQVIGNVILLNLIIAMFIESVQAHLPHRSANIEDLIYGMTGAAGAIFIAMVCRQVHALIAKPKS